MSNFTMKPYGALPCSLQTFIINTIRADMDDFGESESEGDGEYGCAYHRFVADDKVTDAILNKYGISPSEYAEICEELESVLNVGSCGWCS